ncbi:MAG TPA: Hsp20/alpha crystallin family protein [Chloroflexota bacterium]|nr:Hsp20/alpha crystallin family protein [Chloroflexota bacterium]
MAQSQYPVRRGQGRNMPTPFDFWSSFFPSFMGPELVTSIPAPVDVCERENDYVIRMACAGCRPQDIDMTVEGDTVRIRGKFMEQDHGQWTGGQQGQQSQQGQSSGNREICLIRELPTGRFERDITLPTDVNANQAHASFDNGLLTVTLPKAQAAQGHRIQIGQGQTQSVGTGNR